MSGNLVPQVFVRWIDSRTGRIVRMEHVRRGRVEIGGTEDAGDLEDVTEAILAATGIAQDRLMEGSAVVRVWFRDLKKEVNRRRDDRQEPHISDRRLATILTQAGISESWKRNPKNRVGYDLPLGWVRELTGGTPNTTNMPNPAVKDDGVRGVREVRHTPP